jgi:predicted nucleotidyltransferase component of viral defense system
MINLAEIKQEASRNNIREDIIEKDYVFGWVIRGIASNEELKNNLAFKGGTALKKCFFDTYRFSEDLDFTVLSDAVYSKEKFQITVQDVTQGISQASNIQFPQVSVEESQDLKGNPTFQIKISYIGPRKQIGSPAKIKLDLTKFEVVVLPLETKPLFHNYSDSNDVKYDVLCYSLDEILAEKMRSLLERTRARDFYDVWRLLRDHNANINLSRFKESFDKKCGYKSVSLKGIDDFLTAAKEDELRSDWQISLPHQLNYLPNFEIVKDEFLSLIVKILPPLTTPKISSYVHALPVGGRSYLSIPQRFYAGAYRSPLEILKQAGRSQLMVQMTYKNEIRFIEPYSMRVTKDGNLTFFGWQEGDYHIKQFRLDRIQNITLTNKSFYPKFPVEF